ncbi:MAG TPA: calcium-binding protein [Polyangiales bacterium]|nr:calcium-binding protein [Polyangiales bacterium]
MPLDSADTVPDHVDEDCDGVIDEDVDATRARCPRGYRIIEGTRGNDTLRGTWDRDCILGYGGNDTIYGEAGDDIIFGGPGDDRIFTGKGRDVVYAGAGNDTVDTKGSILSLVQGDAGNDTLMGGSGSDTFFGGEDNDKLNGGGGADLLSGGGCHDLITGGSSLDISLGGQDVDACESELAKECERNKYTRKFCSTDADCVSSERCAVFTNFCVPRTAKACGVGPSCVPRASNDETCDGIDDDCDGNIDEEYLAEPTTCGAGSCQATGETSCVNGHVVDSCSPGSPAGSDAICNGVDDDCDGQVDEAYASAPTTCGAGVCGATGATSCVAGTVVDSCRPAMPSGTTDTVCNGLDDDCDGSVDEEFVPGASSCGQGVCVSTGSTSCLDGTVVDTCQPGAPASPTDATCDNIDQDCNGLVDDGFVGTTTHCGELACATTGSTACSAGQVVDTCRVTCEGNCANGGEDDADSRIDCADNDCQNKSEWPQCFPGAIGSPCQNNSQCAAGLTCETTFPGGYCYKECDASGGCPVGSFCWAGVACVQPCVGPAGDKCPRPEHACQPLIGSGVDTPFCRPTCAMSCPSGSTCRTDSMQCM